MRASKYLIATLKETPADAEIISHQLMLRAGMIRSLASGLYTWLPLGLRVLHKVTQIVRQEMDKSGATKYQRGSSSTRSSRNVDSRRTRAREASTRTNRSNRDTV